jgi:hypothetical protein
MRADVSQAEQTVKTLLDKKLELRVRDDCAEELARYSDPVSEEALVRIGADASEDEILLDTCGTSLGERWVRDRRVDLVAMGRLSPVARRIAEAIVSKYAPQLMKR